MISQAQHESKTKLLEAAMHLIRARGFAATTIDDVCREAGVTKGSFFHHFKSKEDLALETAQHFSTMAEWIFATAPYRQLSDPVERLLGYVDFRSQILGGELARYTCLLGTMVQEVYDTHPHIRAVCEQGMSAHVGELTRDIAAAKEMYCPDASWTPESLGYFMQSVLQGSFIFAKATQGPAIARESLEHLKTYIADLFRFQDKPIKRKQT
ncbi:MAG: helix-turn-helix domain-containing protein [Bdellovibrionota bacterium]